MKKVKLPRDMKPRLKDVGQAHGFKGADDFAEHLLVKGLVAYGQSGEGKWGPQLEAVVDEHGYSSTEEVIEHLLERGLSAYSNPEGLDRERFEARLRGLGYID